MADRHEEIGCLPDGRCQLTGVCIGRVVTKSAGISDGIVHPTLSGEILEFQRGIKLVGTYRKKRRAGEIE